MKRILTSALVAALLPLSSFAGNYSFTTSSSPLTDIPHGTAVTWGLSGTSYSSLYTDVKTNGLLVTSASLTLTGIKDWTGEATDPKDALFINLLSGLDTGLKSKAFNLLTPDQPSDDWTKTSNPFIDNTGTSGDWNDILQSTTPTAALNFNDAIYGSLLKANAADTVAGTPAGVTWSDPTGGVTSTLTITFSGDNLGALMILLNSDLNNGTSPNVGLGFAAECHYYLTTATLNVTTGARVPDSGSTLVLMGLGMAALVGFRRAKK